MNVHFLEKAGSFAVLIGTIFLILDPNVQKVGDQEASIFGEILAIICACFFSINLPCNKVLVSKFPSLFVMMANSIISLILTTLIILIFCDMNISSLFSFDSQKGIFGLFSEEHILATCILAPISILCQGGYLLALNYFESHIIGNAFVAEPFLGQILGCVLSQDRIPGILTFIGGFIVLPAILVVAKGSYDLEKSNKN